MATKLPESTNSTASLTSEPEKLLPCPFCKGSPKMANGRSRRSDGTGWLRRVICLDCEAAGPQEYDDDEATAMWNRRLSSPVSGTDMVRDAAQALADRFPHDMPDYAPAYDEVTALRRALSASPSTPIPMIAEAGEREGSNLAERIRAAVTYQYMPMQVRRLLSEAAKALSTPATLDNTAVEGARVAAFHAIYGKQADPFTRPEAYEYASEVADAVLATLTAKTEKADTPTQVNEGDR